MWGVCAGCGTHRNVTQDGQQDVDEEVGVASALEEDTQRRQDDGEKDLADVAGGMLVIVASSSRCRNIRSGERHGGCCVFGLFVESCSFV